MKKRQERKLTLSRETLRYLVTQELEKAKGGLPIDYTEDYASCDHRVCKGQTL